MRSYDEAIEAAVTGRLGSLGVTSEEDVRGAVLVAVLGSELVTEWTPDELVSNIVECQAGLRRVLDRMQAAGSTSAETVG